MADKKQKVIPVTKLTFEYFKAKNGIARVAHTEVVEVFGATNTDCFIEDKEGRALHPDLEEVIYPLIKHETYCKKTDYHTISWSESTRPESWVEPIEE